MKHLLSREQLLAESLGTGSIIFVNGQSKDGMKNLYVTHVKGYKDLGRATMYFLANDFYRVKKDGDSLKAVKVGFDNEEQLKKALSIKKGGEIVSIVGNWKKTPWHRESVKYTSIESALREFKHRILGNGELLLESTQALPDFDDAYEMACVDVLETIFFDKKSIDILSHTDDKGLEHATNDAISDELRAADAEWSIDLTVLFLDEKYNPFIEAGVLNRIETITLFMNSSVGIRYSYDPGDYDTPPYSETDIEIYDTKLIELYVDGSSPSRGLTNKMRELLSSVNKKINDMSDEDISRAIKSVTKSNWYSKFF
jgi:hypothetical protein